MDARPRFYAPRPFMNSVSQTTRDFGLCVSLGGRGAHSSPRFSSSSGKTTGGREKKRLGKKRKNRNKKKNRISLDLGKKKQFLSCTSILCRLYRRVYDAV